MPRRRFYVGPPWPITLADYDYLCAVGEPDWAWEFLRRNPFYQRDQRLYQLFSERPLWHARGLTADTNAPALPPRRDLGPLLLSSTRASQCSMHR